MEEKITSEFNILQTNIKEIWRSNQSDVKEIVANILNSLVFLRNASANGPDIQNYILKLPNFFEVLLPILQNSLNSVDDNEKVHKMCWKLISNLCVMNTSVQKTVWQNLGQLILDKLKNKISVVTDIQLMILHNMIFSSNLEIENSKLLELLLDIWEKSRVLSLPETIKLDFVDIILEHLLIKYPKDIISNQSTADRSHQLSLLRYLSHYIRSDCAIEPLNKILLNFISKEFVMKSDCIIRSKFSDESNDNPLEVYLLLEIISAASGESYYRTFMNDDHPLFLNVGTLLQQINEVGRRPEKNAFTPMQKLEEVALNSKAVENYDFEHEVSFEFKKMLVRTLANLSFKNKKNQQYAREAGILLAVCQCTTMDARNPLIKEWSIFAIRNLCEGCPENQEMIKNLYKICNVPNDIVTELNTDFSTLRINPK